MEESDPTEAEQQQQQHSLRDQFPQDCPLIRPFRSQRSPYFRPAACRFKVPRTTPPQTTQFSRRTHRAQGKHQLHNDSFIIVKRYKQIQPKGEVHWAKPGRIPHEASCPQGCLTQPASLCEDTHAVLLTQEAYLSFRRSRVFIKLSHSGMTN